mmetsp:Transcript_22147/g.68283  ORF Transcript_22147/g.68283 Transcript_22147/m.68283 type:complete len:118 (-) Transcript_22147:1426-1779(-)
MAATTARRARRRGERTATRSDGEVRDARGAATALEELDDGEVNDSRRHAARRRRVLSFRAPSARPQTDRSTRARENRSFDAQGLQRTRPQQAPATRRASGPCKHPSPPRCHPRVVVV